MTRPLDGMIVADLSRVLAGPYATMMLADLGATVVKVERTGLGDDTRRWGPPWTAHSSSYFESANRSKRSLEADFADPADLATVRELVRRADVVVENFRSGGLTPYGLDYAAVAGDNPKVVYCSITGFGDRAGAGRPGYDFLVQAVGGLMSITGPVGGPPTKVGVALVDILTGKDAVIGILAALAARRSTGRGQHVQVDLLSSLLGSLANQAGAYLTTGSSPGPLGNRHPSIAPYETLRCRDRSIAVCCGNDEQFRGLVEVLGIGTTVMDRSFGTNADRVRHRDELIDVLEAALAVADADEWVAKLGIAGVPAGQVGDIAAAFELADSLGLDPLIEVGADHPRQVRHPIRYSETVVVPPSPPPALGEHNQDVRDWLIRERTP